MMRGPSLKRPLIVYPLIVHLATLLISVLILMVGALRIDSGGPYADERVIPVIAAAIERDQTGALVVRPTEALEGLQTEAPGLWFLAEDEDGHSVGFGASRRPMKGCAGGWWICPSRSCATSRRPIDSPRSCAARRPRSAR
ncbi:hypothetical protein [Paracoccus sp. PAMC 22219]|uniref:hypothetical protein n=1 Tax=Paracoccus sp. PAMC 22219 TaxID=1569209 RepID=UPI000A8B58C7|nr:hypothetical protein [Paracoccus sp. PAMC 22219]